VREAALDLQRRSPKVALSCLDESGRRVACDSTDAVLRDIDRLRVPNLQKDGRMSVYLEVIRRLAEMTRGEAAVRASGTDPFSLAAHLMGPKNFCRAGHGRSGTRRKGEQSQSIFWS
jgi:hypothetical protein